MNYIVNEYQTNGGQTIIATPASFADRNEAEADFHTKAAAASLSSNDVHTVTLTSEDGREVRKPECYRHGTEE